MKVNRDFGITLAIVLIFVWLTAISFAIIDMYANTTFCLEDIQDIYEMITDIYRHISNILNMGMEVI